MDYIDTELGLSNSGEGLNKVLIYVILLLSFWKCFSRQTVLAPFLFPSPSPSLHPLLFRVSVSAPGLAWRSFSTVASARALFFLGGSTGVGVLTGSTAATSESELKSQ